MMMMMVVVVVVVMMMMMMMMSIYISSSPLVLLHNHTSVTMVGSTHCFERAAVDWLRQSQPLAYHGMF